MAKAGGTPSTDSISLRDALALATAALKSEPLAKKRLVQWMSAEDGLPWTCIEWQGLDAEGLGKLQNNEMLVSPSGAYSKGDPRFWGIVNLVIDWEHSSAREPGLVAYGAQAEGVTVPRVHLLKLLPGKTRKPGKPRPQRSRVKDAIRKRWPGGVPADVPTGTVRALIADDLATDSKKKGLAAPSWDTTNRALGRAKK